MRQVSLLVVVLASMVPAVCASADTPHNTLLNTIQGSDSSPCAAPGDKPLNAFGAQGHQPASLMSTVFSGIDRDTIAAVGYQCTPAVQRNCNETIIPRSCS